MEKLIKLSIYAMFVVMTFQAQAALSPVAIGIVKPLQFPPDDFNITGARFSLLWGEHRDMYGLDVGVLGNITMQDYVGIAVSGVFNITHGNTYIIGLQAAGLVNYNTQKTEVYGLQVALGMNSNEAESSVTGLQLALLANIAPHTTINGFQVGIFNRAQIVRGLQIGVVNVTDNLHGLQIGLLNFNHGGTFVVSPILNAGF